MSHSLDAGRIVGLSLAGALGICIGGTLPFATSAAAEAQAAPIAISDKPAAWAEELTAPRAYISNARRAVDRHHYMVAARNLRHAATMVSKQESYAIGRERARLHIAVAALRLTAKDVEAGAVDSSAQLDAILHDTHRDLLARHPLQQ
jgi:hypothetical protein